MNHPLTLKPDLPTTQAWRDPVLEELWAVKRAINRESEFDLRRLFEQSCLAARAWVDAGHGRTQEVRSSALDQGQGGS